MAYGNTTIGFPWKRVTVEEVVEGTALVVDEFGKRMSLPAEVRRGSGSIPQANEEWIIDQTLGGWTFAAVVRSVRPIITGTTDGNPALASLIAALVDLGLVDDQTTSERIRATHLHTHVAPAEGGTTSTETPS